MPLRVTGMWQDWALTVVQFVFIASLLPTVLHPEHKPTLSTSIVTACGVCTVAYVYWTLSLWVSFFAGVVLGIEWATLAYQRWRLDRK